jgi:hypothetical protein
MGICHHPTQRVCVLLLDCWFCRLSIIDNAPWLFFPFSILFFFVYRKYPEWQARSGLHYYHVMSNHSWDLSDTEHRWYNRETKLRSHIPGRYLTLYRKGIMPSHISHWFTSHSRFFTCVYVQRLLMSKNVNSMVTFIHNLQASMETDLLDTVVSIHTLIPQTKPFDASRSELSFLPFIGNLAKGLYGTSTVRDVNLLASYIYALNRKTRLVTHVL